MEGRKILRREWPRVLKTVRRIALEKYGWPQNFLDLWTPSPWIGPKIFKRFFPKVLVPDKEGRIMFRILVYDVQVSRVSKVRRYLSDKLFWTQNSTFEGFLSDPQKRIVLQQLSSFLDPEEDSVLVFRPRPNIRGERNDRYKKRTYWRIWLDDCKRG